MGGEKERRKGKDEGKARRTERGEGRPGNEVCRREGASGSKESNGEAKGEKSGKSVKNRESDIGGNADLTRNGKSGIM